MRCTILPDALSYPLSSSVFAALVLKSNKAADSVMVAF